MPREGGGSERQLPRCFSWENQGSLKDTPSNPAKGSSKPSLEDLAVSHASTDPLSLFSFTQVHQLPVLLIFLMQAFSLIRALAPFTSPCCLCLKDHTHAISCSSNKPWWAWFPYLLMTPGVCFHSTNTDVEYRVSFTSDNQNTSLSTCDRPGRILSTLQPYSQGCAGNQPKNKTQQKPQLF